MWISKTPTYRCWAGMKQRCCNKNNKNYALYGGRDIKICERWKDSFENFVGDMGEKPEGLTIDRINNDGNYEPGNCRWADRKTQVSNRRVSINVNGYTLPDYCKFNNLTPSSIYSRLARGWSLEMAISKPTKREFSLTRYCRENNLNYYVMRTRLRKGWTIEKAQETPIGKSASPIIVRGVRLRQYCIEHNLPYTTILSRLHHGWDVNVALDSPIIPKYSSRLSYSKGHYE